METGGQGDGATRRRGDMGTSPSRRQDDERLKQGEKPFSVKIISMNCLNEFGNVGGEDRASQLYTELSDLLAKIEIDSDEEADVDVVCNKAWTYLKIALNEIYEGGKYAFPEGTERHSLYYNDYYKRLSALGAKQRAKNDNETSDSSDETQEIKTVSA
jgi:hypothetical protein